MISEALLMLIASSLSILLQFLQPSDAYLQHDNVCTNSCGTILNIRSPFRLKDDPQTCGDPNYELSCESNVTTLHLASRRFQVKSIDYQNDKIRVSDASITTDLCSFPQFSISAFNFSNNYPYSISATFYFGDAEPQVASPVNFMSCPLQLNDSSPFTELASDCGNFTDRRFSYVKIGHMNASDVRHMCRVDRIVLTSWKFRDLGNVSVAEIHEALVYGFEMSWHPFRCVECKPGEWMCTDIKGRVDCREGSRIQLHMTMWAVILVLLVVVPGCVGAKIIIGFAYFWLMFVLSNISWIFNSLQGGILKLLLIPGICIAARFIIVFPCFMGFLIYKFRRRHLSAFDAIENFLQSDNHLMPIRYSYSNIKRMTRGFREKLGQGGYGTVYKGKLQSGHDVAVKLLDKAGGNGQDFMSEISTIGRIHHVNVVKLVGYCAEGSKRALIFDFMPNGSLDKYIYGREKMNCLSWEKKYEIAIGVARGIDYLHKGCDVQILHFDIKPHNILLDDNFTPKITDFGLAKFFSTDKKVVTMTAIRGTIGYVAPELINRGFGGVSYKADVYSFGMLLIEMAGLKRDLQENDQTHSEYFPCWIYDRFEQGNDIDYDVIDDTDREIGKKMTIVALWCIQMSPGDRPSMNKVVEMLEGQVERLRVPNRPSQSAQIAVNNEDQSWTTYSTDSISLLPLDATFSLEISVED